MSYSTYRYRRGAKRVASLIATASLVGAGAVATTGVAYAEDTPTENLVTFDPSDFAEQAASLPASLQHAVQDDLGISPAEYLANAEATKVASDVAAALKADGVGVVGVSIDGQDVTLHVDSEADVAAAESVGANVEVGRPAQEDYSDHKFEAKVALRGGYGYLSYLDGSSVTRCSLGFAGYNNGGADRYLTAGHCGLNGDTDLEDIAHLDVPDPIEPNEEVPQEQVGDPIGNHVAGASHFGGNIDENSLDDGGLIDVTNADWDNVPQVSEWGGGQGDPTDGAVTIFDTVDAVVGADVCKSGATSGWTCGEILTAEDAVTFETGETVSGFIMDTCMLGGDSGGSIVVGNFALGVNSGSGFTTCDDEGAASIGYAVSGGEFNAFDLYGDQWELNVAVNTPVIDQATASDEGATLTGTVENAGADHRVELSVEGVGDFDADVNADGEFTVEIDQALEAGSEHNFTAQAFYRQFSSSEVTEGSFTVSEEEPEPEVADLVVSSPGDGQTSSNPRPSFEGTGEPGAEVTLAVGDNEFGATTVGDEGNWEIAPESDLPGGVRFDATVTQVAGEDTQTATVADLGIKLDDVTITVPEESAEVPGDVVFEGTSFPGADIGLVIEGTIAVDASSGDATSLSAASEGFEPAEEEGDLEAWEGEFEIDDEGNWTFTPAEALADGEYTLTASAMLDGGDPELSSSETSVSFTVATSDGGGDDLPDTGSNNLPMILIGVGLLAAGGSALALRARRNATKA